MTETEELAELLKVSWEKADSIRSGFMSGANLMMKRDYWAAKTPKARAKVIKIHWTR